MASWSSWSVSRGLLPVRASLIPREHVGIDVDGLGLHAPADVQADAVADLLLRVLQRGGRLGSPLLVLSQCGTDQQPRAQGDGQETLHSVFPVLNMMRSYAGNTLR